LQSEGLSREAYYQRFSSDVLQHYPELKALQEESLATINSHFIILNDRGIAYSDVIGSWFFSSAVKQKIKEYQCR
jgi:hypothetical protein